MARPVGRPIRDPSGDCVEVVELAVWLKAVLADHPKITLAKVAEYLTDMHGGKKVWTAKISQWLSGKDQPPFDVIEAIIALRVQDSEYEHDGDRLRHTARFMYEAATEASRPVRRAARPPSNPSRTRAPVGALRSLTAASAIPAERASVGARATMESLSERLRAAENRSRRSEVDLAVAKQELDAARAQITDAHQEIGVLLQKVSNDEVEFLQLRRACADQEADIRRLNDQVVSLGVEKLDLQVRVEELAGLAAQHDAKDADIRRLNDQVVSLGVEKLDLQVRVEELAGLAAQHDAKNQRDVLEDGIGSVTRDDIANQVLRDVASARAEIKRATEDAERDRAAAREMRYWASHEAVIIKARAQQEAVNYEEQVRRLGDQIADLILQRDAAAKELAAIQGTLDSVADSASAFTTLSAHVEEYAYTPASYSRYEAYAESDYSNPYENYPATDYGANYISTDAAQSETHGEAESFAMTPAAGTVGRHRLVK